MKKLLLPAILLVLMVAPVMGLEAVISPGDPDDIVLNGSDYSATKTFDGEASGGSIQSYTWTIDGEDTRSGSEVDLFFNRSNSSSIDIKLTVSNQTDSDSTTVTQDLRDIPEIVSTPSDKSSVEIDSSVTFESSDYEIENYFDDPLSYSWDLVSPSGSDDDSGSGESFTHTYSSEGTYELELNVTDGAEKSKAASKVQIDVENTTDTTDTEETTQDGGGGAGTTSENTFDETYVLGDLVADFSKTATFTQSPIFKVNITASDTEENTELKSGATDERPDEADEDPQGKVFKFVELKKVNFTNNDIEKVEFYFEVEKSWLDENNILESTVTLQRYDNGWEEIETEKMGDDGDHVNFTAESTGFSVFAITAEEAKAEFEVNKLEVKPSTIKPGENVSVTVKVENKGNIDGNYTISFGLGDRNFSRKLTNISPGETAEEVFNTSVESGGNYTVEVEGVTKQLSVGQGSTSAEEEGSGMGILPIAALIILTLLVVGGVLAYIEREEIIEFLEEQGLWQEVEPVVEEVKEILDLEDDSDDIFDNNDDDFDWEFK